MGTAPENHFKKILSDLRKLNFRVFPIELET